MCTRYWKRVAQAMGRGLVAALLLHIAGASHAHTAVAPGPRSGPHQVEPFDAATMATWRTTLTRPTWVVFTATWCAVCPAVIADIQRVAHEHPRRPRVWAVVIDVAPGDDDARLLSHEYLRHTDRLLAFDGIPAAIRHGVDPSWRGSVPHVALMEPGGRVRLYRGKPPLGDLMR